MLLPGWTGSAPSFASPGCVRGAGAGLRLLLPGWTGSAHSFAPPGGVRGAGAGMRLLLPAWTRTDFSWRRHSTPTRESPRHFCAGLRLCSGQALTTRGRHAQWLVCPTWARDSVGDRPLLRWAHDLCRLGPYLALGRDRATFALGLGPLALPLLCTGPRLWGLCICQGLRQLALSLRAALFLVGEHGNFGHFFLQFRGVRWTSWQVYYRRKVQWASKICCTARQWTHRPLSW